MAYTKNIWVDQDVERPKTYEVTNNQDGSITLTDSFGLVEELGTPVNALNMNHIENGIDGCAIRKHNLTETFTEGEWVLGGTGDAEGVYKSLIPNNVGNAISDTTAWQKVEMVDISNKADVDLTNVNDAGNIKMAHNAMPSSIYDTLLFGASGATYTMPADGWLYFRGGGVQSANYIAIANSAGLEVFSQTPGAGYGLQALMPVKKGDIITIEYGNGTPTVIKFRFYYANGSESEAQ